MREPNNAIVHFYRAAFMHTDVWRRRTDATTNWAVVSTAALITFTFSDAKNPHFILLVGFAFDMFFLLMESRRYQTLQRWRVRVHQLNRWVVAPHLSPRNAPSAEEIEDGLEELALDLANSRPKVSLLEAIGYRTRRNYAFVFVVVLLTWLLKIWYHPHPGGNLVERATIGVVPGGYVLIAVFLAFAVLMILALGAPTEETENWEPLGSPMERMIGARPRLDEVRLPFQHGEADSLEGVASGVSADAHVPGHPLVADDDTDEAAADADEPEEGDVEKT